MEVAILIGTIGAGVGLALATAGLTMHLIVGAIPQKHR